MTSTTITVEYNGTSYENVAATQYDVVVMDANNVVLHTDVEYEYTHPATDEAVVIAVEETIPQNPEGIAPPDGIVALPDLIVKRIILGKPGQPSPVNSAAY